MELSQLVAQYRADADDLVAPYLSSTVLVRGWINEAEEEAAVRGRLLFESSNADICQIVVDAAAVTAGTRVYTLHESVFHITRAVFIPDGSTTEYELHLTDRVEQDRAYPGWRSRVDIPRQAIQDDTKLELGCKPSVAGVIHIECYRTPLVLIEDSATETPEIHRSHHRHLIHWVLHRAYSRPDAEIYDPKRAAREEAMFTEHFGIRPNAQNRRNLEANRQHHNRAW